MKSEIEFRQPSWNFVEDKLEFFAVIGEKRIRCFVRLIVLKFFYNMRFDFTTAAGERNAALAAFNANREQIFATAREIIRRYGENLPVTVAVG